MTVFPVFHTRFYIKARYFIHISPLLYVFFFPYNCTNHIKKKLSFGKIQTRVYGARSKDFPPTCRTIKNILIGNKNSKTITIKTQTDKRVFR